MSDAGKLILKYPFLRNVALYSALPHITKITAQRKPENLQIESHASFVLRYY